MRYVSHQLSLHFATSLLVEFKTFASTQCAICESDFFLKYSFVMAQIKWSLYNDCQYARNLQKIIVVGVKL